MRLPKGRFASLFYLTLQASISAFSAVALFMIIAVFVANWTNADNPFGIPDGQLCAGNPGIGAVVIDHLGLRMFVAFIFGLGAFWSTVRWIPLKFNSLVSVVLVAVLIGLGLGAQGKQVPPGGRSCLNAFLDTLGQLWAQATSGELGPIIIVIVTAVFALALILSWLLYVYMNWMRPPRIAQSPDNDDPDNSVFKKQKNPRSTPPSVGANRSTQQEPPRQSTATPKAAKGQSQSPAAGNKARDSKTPPKTQRKSMGERWEEIQRQKGKDSQG